MSQQLTTGISDPAAQGKGTLERKLFPWSGDYITEYPGKPVIHKSMGPDGIHLRVLGELADAIARLLMMVFERP